VTCDRGNDYFDFQRQYAEAAHAKAAAHQARLLATMKALAGGNGATNKNNRLNGNSTPTPR
jgi:hypothetical protein